MILVKNNDNGTNKSITIEIEKYFHNKPLKGLNLAIIGTHDDELIVNTVITYKEVLEIYSELTKYITEVQQTLIS